jgi:hypothetical protein
MKFRKSGYFFTECHIISHTTTTIQLVLNVCVSVCVLRLEVCLKNTIALSHRVVYNYFDEIKRDDNINSYCACVLIT